MKNNNFRYILLLFLFFILTSCRKNDKETYTVSGRFVDGTHPTNKFANLKLTFEDYHNHRELVTLGETYTDSNGFFKFSYEYESTFLVNYMRIFVDSNIIAAKKLYSFELGSNWNRTFYLGDSALLNLKIDTSINANDTLYFTNGDSLYTIPGPILFGSKYRLKLLNQDSDGLVGYCVGKNQYPAKLLLSYYVPTGEPIIDDLIIY